MYVFGDCGTGKTHTMYALMRLFSEMKLQAKMYNSSEMLDLLREDFQYQSDRNHEDILKYNGVLMIDDVGSEKHSEWVAEAFYKIVNKRYEEKWPIIISSNLNLDELSSRVTDRVSSRIAEMCEVYELTGEDKRISS
jgi:DNA replication protein DnaC